MADIDQVVAAAQVDALAVLGAGTMGHGIAQVAAQAGVRVTLQDVVDGAAATGIERIAANLEKGVSLGKVTVEARDGALARIRPALAVADAVADADVVIEAVPEKLALKREVFAQVAASAPGHALLATNTSSLSIAEIASTVSSPSRVVGMHFFNPVHIMKLVEVVRHSESSDEAIACARGLAERFCKTPITVNDVPGFASSRLGICLGLEAMRMVEQGVASAEDIDTAMKLGYGHPMGPLRLTDLVGLDVRLSIAEYLTAQLGNAFAPPDILRKKVAEGKLGKKAGEGFYRW